MVLVLLTSCVTVFSADELTIEAILKNHGETVGSESDRKRAGSRIAIGKSEFELTLPSWSAAGKVVFASDDRNIMLISSFDVAEYPFEKIGLFNGKIDIPFTTPGSRSPMGSYLLLNDNIVSEKLFGGVISSGWKMLNPAPVLDRMRLAGTKKVGGREAYVIRYNAKGNASADSGIDLFFDAKNFRHVRAEYRQKIPEKYFYRMGIFGNQEGENMNQLIEEFGDFRKTGGLELPHKYTVKLIIDGRSGTKEFRWTFVFDEYRLGQNFGEDFFTFERK